MKRQPVSSSNLRSVGYDPETKTLEVEFQNGSVYQYFNVPNNVYRELMAAPSHGRYFHKVHSEYISFKGKVVILPVISTIINRFFGPLIIP